MLQEARRLMNEESNKGDDASLGNILDALAELNEKRGNTKDAEQYYKAAVSVFGGKETAFPAKLLAVEITASYPIILYNTGKFYEKKGDKQAAADYYSRSMKAWGNWTDTKRQPALDARVKDYKGRALKALGREDEAKEYLTGALAGYRALYNPKDPRITQLSALLSPAGTPRPRKE